MNAKTFLHLNPCAAAVALSMTLAGCAHVPLRQQAAFEQTLSEPPPGVVLPLAVRTVAPAYPDHLIRAGMPGSVWVRCWVTASGGIEDVAAFEATLPEFGEAAMTALKQWSFAPGTRDGRRLGMWIAIPFHFVPVDPSDSAFRR